MPRYGYARVSTTDQDLAVQREALERAGCAVICEEKVSGTSRQGREELAILLTFLQPGDELVVTRVDRLARSIGGPAGHRARAAREESGPRRHGAADRHIDRSRQGLPRHAG